MPSRLKTQQTRAQRPEQEAASFDFGAELARLTKKLHGDAKNARIIAETKAERIKLGMTHEQYNAYSEQRYEEAKARKQAEREAAKKAEEEARATNDDGSWEDEEYDERPARAERSRPEKTTKREPARSGARGFAALPYLVLDRLLPVLPDAAFKVYAALLRFEGYKSRAMWPGQDRLAEMTGQSEMTVWRSITLLCKAGLLRRQRRFGTSNMYERIEVSPQNVDSIVAKLKARPVRTMTAADVKRVRSQSRHA